MGDPHDELLGAWLAKESVRDTYLSDDAGDEGPLAFWGEWEPPSRISSGGLPPGSLMLFGSSRGDEFLVDTVFVVADAVAQYGR